MDIFTILFYQPIYNLIIFIYQTFGQDLGVAIILMALVFRTITIPITLRQIRFSKQSQELQEKMNELKKLHKNNKQKLQEEQMKLQQEYLPGQLSACLPMILQLVMFSQIYIVLRNIFDPGPVSFNEVAYGFMPTFAEGDTLNTMFLGIDLTKSAGSIGYDDIGRVLPYVALAVLVAVAQYLSTRILMARRKSKQEDSKKKSDDKKEKKADKPAETPDDFAEIMQRSTGITMIMLPMILGFGALGFPAGLSVYWTVQSGFVIIQQLIVEQFQKRNG